MPQRKIVRNPDGKNFYVLDACFLVNKFIPPELITNQYERSRIECSLDWWEEIDYQVKEGRAFIYVPDLCIAESFKVLAKKYYIEKVFTLSTFKQAREKLQKFLRTSPKSLKSFSRNIRVHDVSTSRDIVISVDRFFEVFMKSGHNVQIVDLMVLATAKYLMDFFHIPRDRLFIVTLDNALWQGTKSLQDIPSAFNPNKVSDRASKVFEDLVI